MPPFDLPANAPVWLYALMICVSAAVPLIGAVALIMKRRSEAELAKVRAQIDAQKAHSDREMEQMKADTSQALAASKSIEALTNTLVTMVEERRESTAATKENTTELKNFTARIGDWDERQRLFFQTFTANTAAFNLDVSSAIKGLQTVTTEAIAGMLQSIDNMIPKLVENVTPLVDRMDVLMSEVQRSSDLATTGRDSAVVVLTQEINSARDKIVSEVHRLEVMIQEAMKVYEDATETPAHVIAAAVLPDVIPAGDGAGPGFGIIEYQPALI